MTNADFRNEIGVPSITVVKMTNGKKVSIAVIMKVGNLFNSDIGDAAEIEQ